MATGDDERLEQAADQRASAGLACVACDYDLTGVSIGSACPECGQPVSLTIQHGRAMTRRQAVIVLLRLISLSLVFSSLVVIDFIIWVLVAFSGVSSYIIWDSDMGWYTLIQGSSTLTRLLAAVVLWWIAPRLAAWFVKADGALTTSSRTNPRTLFSVGLLLIGVYATLRGISSGLNILVSETASSFGYGSGYFLLTQNEQALFSAIAWLAGGLLLILSPKLRSWLGRDLSRS